MSTAKYIAKTSREHGDIVFSDDVKYFHDLKKVRVYDTRFTPPAGLPDNIFIRFTLNVLADLDTAVDSFIVNSTFSGVTTTADGLEVDWGDGSNPEAYSFGDKMSHAFYPAGEYTVTIKATGADLSIMPPDIDWANVGTWIGEVSLLEIDNQDLVNSDNFNFQNEVTGSPLDIIIYGNPWKHITSGSPINFGNRFIRNVTIYGAFKDLTNADNLFKRDFIDGTAELLSSVSVLDISSAASADRLFEDRSAFTDAGNIIVSNDTDLTDMFIGASALERATLIGGKGTIQLHETNMINGDNIDSLVSSLVAATAYSIIILPVRAAGFSVVPMTNKSYVYSLGGEGVMTNVFNASLVMVGFNSGHFAQNHGSFAWERGVLGFTTISALSVTSGGQITLAAQFVADASGYTQITIEIEKVGEYTLTLDGVNVYTTFVGVSVYNAMVALDGQALRVYIKKYG